MVWRVRYGGSKYRSKSSHYNGILYHSQAEASYAMGLDLRVKAKDILRWERQVKIPLDVNGRHICNYFIDFIVTALDGEEEYIEIKGFSTEVFRLKRKLFEAVYPDKKYTMIQV